jgi:hypothetical protein
MKTAPTEAASLAGESATSSAKPRSDALNPSDKALSALAFGALIDVMHEAWLVRCRFGARKAHSVIAFRARGVFIETLWG